MVEVRSSLIIASSIATPLLTAYITDAFPKPTDLPEVRDTKTRNIVAAIVAGLGVGFIVFLLSPSTTPQEVIYE